LGAAPATAAKEEGSFVDTAIGKEKAEQLKLKFKESEQMGQQFVGKITEGAGKVVKTAPATEDFFADFGFLDKKAGGSGSGQKGNGTASIPQAETSKSASKKPQPTKHLSQVSLHL
jgi:hypothetical protein